MNDAAPFRPAGTLAISTALAPYSGPWNERLAAHLLRRAAFGGSPSDVVKVSKSSMNAAVDSFVRFDPNVNVGEPADIDENYSMETKAAFIGAAMGMKNDDELQKQRKIVGETRRKVRMSLQLWWLNRMLTSPAPLQEKMTLLWHGHFTSAVGQKGITGRQAFNQNQLFRQYALGNVRDLTQAVSRDPAMLKYLDNARSVKEHPNENYARELMELFTLGIGNYTEADVRESARAFTGWSIRRVTGEFYENPRQHDDGSKTFLGRTGNFDGNDIVGIIFQQPAAAQFFAKTLLNFFVYNDPEPELVDAVAGLIRKNDFAMLPVVSTLLRSNVFYSDRAYRALVKSPVEFVVGSYQLFGVTEADKEMLGVLNRLGQVLFVPPSVKGWDGGAAWVNSQSVLTRENFASALMNSKQLAASQNWLTSSPPGSAKDAASGLVSAIVQGDASPASMARLVAYLNGADVSADGMLSGENIDERIRGAAYLTMAMPAYQLN